MPFDPNALATFVRGTVGAAYEGGANPNDPPPGEAAFGGSLPTEGGAPTLADEILRRQRRAEVAAVDEDEPDVDEPAVGEEAEAEADGPSVQEAWDALTDAEQKAVLGDPKALDAWSRALATDGQAADAADAAAETGDVEIETARELVAVVIANPDLLDGMEVGEWLRWAATCSPGEWRDAAAEAGWPEDVRPAVSDWPQDLQTQAISDRFDARLAAIKRGEAPYL
jgi:hypothetical protein